MGEQRENQEEPPQVKLEDDQSEDLGLLAQRLRKAISKQEQMLKYTVAALQDMAQERSFSMVQEQGNPCKIANKRITPYTTKKNRPHYPT